MTTVTSSFVPVWRFADNNNNPLVGGKVYTYYAGTTTPAATYTDATGSTPLTNPIILNARGETANASGASCSVWFSTTIAYKIVVQDSSGNLIWTVDNYTIPSQAYSAAYADTFTATAGQTVFTLTGTVGSQSALDVSLDGATLVNGVDFTWTSPSTLTLTVGAKAGQILLVKYLIAQAMGTMVAGGTSGQILYNNGGSVQGFTMSGDVTVVPTTGVATVNAPGTHITYTQGGTGSTSRTVTSKLQETISVLDFGADPTGATSSNTAFVNFFAASTGKICYIPAGTYKLTSLISVGLSNCIIQGVPGQTTITGGFDYAVLQLLDLSNVQFRDIIFQTTYVNSTEDSGKSVVYSLQSNVNNVVFSRCTFTGVNANTSGLTFYLRTAYNDTTAKTIDGLWIEDCLFTNLQRLCCTIMNRGSGSDKYTVCHRVYFRRNKGLNTGLAGLYGYIVSLDGYGANFDVSDNEAWNVFGTVIENTGWIDGSICNNRLMSAASTCQLLSINGTNGSPDGNRQMINLTVVGNQCLVVATNHSNVMYVSNSFFANNYFWSNATGQAVLFRYSYDNRFSKENYINANVSSGNYAILADSQIARNTWDGSCIFDNSASTANYATVRFMASGTTSNYLQSGAQIKQGTGGSIFDQISGAAGNWIEDIAQSWTPVIAGASTPGTPTYSVQSGQWWRSGKRVSFSFRVSVTALGGMAGNVIFTGLPFTSSSSLSTNTLMNAHANGVTLAGSNTFYYGEITPSSTQISFTADGSATGSTPVQASWLASSTTVIMSGTYFSA